jgi:hypothetical protein
MAALSCPIFAAKDKSVMGTITTDIQYRFGAGLEPSRVTPRILAYWRELIGPEDQLALAAIAGWCGISGIKRVRILEADRRQEKRQRDPQEISTS